MSTHEILTERFGDLRIDDLKLIGEQLRVIRRFREITQYQLGTQIGLSESAVGNIENGRHSLSLISFLDICDYLSISPSRFFDCLTLLKQWRDRIEA